MVALSVNKSQETTVFSGCQKIDFRHETEARRIIVNLMLYTGKSS